LETSEVYGCRTTVYKALEKYDLELADFSAAIKVNKDSDYLHPYSHCGEMYEKTGKKNLAIADHKVVVANAHLENGIKR
jgi:hypothetical protein